jgi:hypothetical protein
LKTAVAFFIFNRPDTTVRVFEEIRRAKPLLLLVVADGPRKGRPGEPEQCASARAVIEQVDWPCEVRKNYSEVNLGCKGRLSSGLTWVFEEVTEAIILEDDCLPDKTFFHFSEELLQKFRDDDRVGQISGTNFLLGAQATKCSYFFSRFYQAWGWASWRRAWKDYDVNMNDWPEIRKGEWLRDLLGSQRFVPYWTYVLEKVYRGEIDTWDYQWMFRCWVQNRLAVLPSRNLVSNLGFDARATHTKGGWKRFRNIEREPIAFPLSHPPSMIRNADADKHLEVQKHLVPSPLFNMLLYKLKIAREGL